MSLDVEIDQVSKVYGHGDDQVRALEGVSLSLSPGEFLAVVGPSGCGKSTLLKAVGGLTSPSGGTIRVGDRIVDGPSYDTAIVFQDASLLPWRSTLRNVAYGMELQRRLSREEVRERASEALELVGLSGFESHYPSQLSGGMQQRVNLARALAIQPQVLLMDEPFGALDAMTKQTMQAELQRIAAITQHTVMFITHDIAEAVYLADRVAVMTPRPGRLVEVVDIPVEQPRSTDFLSQPQFVQLKEHISHILFGTEGPASDGPHAAVAG